MKQDRRKQIIALLLAASIVSLSATGCAPAAPRRFRFCQQEQQQPEQQPESAAQTPDSTEAAAQPEEAPPSEQAEQPEQDEEPVPGLSDQETADSGQDRGADLHPATGAGHRRRACHPGDERVRKGQDAVRLHAGHHRHRRADRHRDLAGARQLHRAAVYLEQRALSVLLYHVGMCEDYAAALTLLYRAAGLQAEYVPGITYSGGGGAGRPLLDDGDGGQAVVPRRPAAGGQHLPPWLCPLPLLHARPFDPRLPLVGTET